MYGTGKFRRVRKARKEKETEIVNIIKNKTKKNDNLLGRKI